MTPAPGDPRRRWVRVLLWLAAAALLVAISVPTAVGGMLASFAGTRPQDLRDRSSPGDYGRSYRTVFLESADRVRLSSWLIRPDASAGCSVVVVHGLFRSRREVLDRAARLAGRGCHVLALDLRRHGESGGNRTSLGFFEALDVRAGAEFLIRQFPRNRLYLMGVSMGGAAVARAAVALDREADGVVLDSTFRNVPEVVDRYAQLLFRLPPFPAGDLTLVGLGLAAGFEPRDLDVEDLSRTLGERGIPVLVIAGDADRRAPLAAQEAIFRANRDPRSRVLVIEDASHGRPCVVEPDVCAAAVGEFLRLPIGEAGIARQVLYDPAR